MKILSSRRLKKVDSAVLSHGGGADVFTVAAVAFAVCRQAQERRVGLLAASAKDAAATCGAREMAAAEVHQEGAESSRAGAGRVDAFFAGRPALDAQHAAHQAREIGVRRRIVLVELAV